ncbi:carboxypeptidase-like regulatory domain-containing protein [Bacteroides sp. GM023]|uniref:carboxypeptidase-like regulatory domain-containing protein n=1 Tax=Bacteroides sp. GM023 TaxID=2723058 RepID=UPI00168AA907|nr:carboxypeptidase-like regulatory domain-containing protein [Bacteroides sp. GM023]MBD3591841.1 carboxypeptidase-like regulatory domain-containing protein [Bacteroides sp. GM023]
MKPAYYYLSILFLLFFGFDTMRADGEDVLEQIVRLPKTKATVYSLLGDVSQQSGYMFIYDSKVIDNDVVVKIKEGKRTIRQAVYDIIGDTDLEFKVIGTHILITSPSGQDFRTLQDSLPLQQTVNLIIAGTLLDKETGVPIPSATVGVRGTSVGSITNQDGDFKLSLPDSLKQAPVAFSHIGYISQDIELSMLLGRHNILNLEPKVVPLQEVVIRRSDPRKLLREMIERRERNYSHSPVYLTTFYREGVQLKNKFQNLSEGVFKVYKTFSSSLLSDQVKLLKMSRLSNVEVKDSLLVKVKSGIQACLQMDLIKDMPAFMIPNIENNTYVYTSEGMTFLDNRFVNIVHFEPRKDITEPLFCGELFLDSETCALLQARLEVHPKYVKDAAGMFVERRTRNIRMIPQKVVYTISYKPWQGTYYIHHIRGDLYFKVKHRGMLFGSRDLHIWFEMITCKVDTEQVTAFPRIDRLSTRTIFSDTNFKYDENFWKEFNIIPLEAEISKLIEKVSLKIEEIGD